MKLRWGLVLTSTLFLSLFLSGHADAQQKQGTPARVAWVSVLSLAQVASYLDAFRSGLAAEGYVEGSDVEVLARSADGDPARLSVSWMRSLASIWACPGSVTSIPSRSWIEFPLATR